MVQPSQVGPPSPIASSSSSAASPQRVFTTRVEPYDSPLKPSYVPDTAGYATGGQAIDEEGDVDRLAMTAGSSPTARRDKGKGRAQEVDVTEYGRVAEDDRQSLGSEDRDEDPPLEPEDEEAEARRIQENLARWSRADSKRRASLRRSSTLVYPALPSPPPVPSATTLIRRTSTLIRTASKRRAGSREFAHLEPEEVELGDGRASVESSPPPLVGGSVVGRRGRKKLSVVTGQGKTASAVGALPRVGEEADDSDPAKTPTTATQPTPVPNFTLLSPSSTPLSAPPAPPLPDPFSPSPSNASFVSLASTARSDRAVKTGSRFIEDLPPLPLSPIGESPHHGNPFVTPTTPTNAASLPFSMRTAPSSSSSPPRANPFSDVIVISPPNSPPHPSSSVRPQALSRPSQTTISTLSSTATATASSYVPYSRSSTMDISQPPSPSSPRSPPFAANGTDRQRDEGTGRVGLLNWLMCGCFRAGSRDNEGVEQQGRTNPME
ncbi:hypothetical protein JCM11251_007508 [Rhodosporidiobolus azoricus]